MLTELPKEISNDTLHSLQSFLPYRACAMRPLPFVSLLASISLFTPVLGAPSDLTIWIQDKCHDVSNGMLYEAIDEGIWTSKRIAEDLMDFTGEYMEDGLNWFFNMTETSELMLQTAGKVYWSAWPLRFH
jgi:hypothetical protein